MESDLLALTKDGVDFFRASLSTEGEFRLEKLKHVQNASIAQWSPKGDAVNLRLGRVRSPPSCREARLSWPGV